MNSRGNLLKDSAIDVLYDEKLEGKKDNIVNVPIASKITVEWPMFKVENIEDYVPYPKGRIHENSFMIKARGENMVHADILEGDLVIVCPESEAENGDIVVAITDQNEVVIKPFNHETCHQLDSSSLDPIQVRIVGKVLGIMSRFQ